MNVLTYIYRQLTFHVQLMSCVSTVYPVVTDTGVCVICRVITMATSVNCVSKHALYAFASFMFIIHMHHACRCILHLCILQCGNCSLDLQIVSCFLNWHKLCPLLGASRRISYLCSFICLPRKHPLLAVHMRACARDVTFMGKSVKKLLNKSYNRT